MTTTPPSPPTETLPLAQLVSYLPPQIWYLTSDGGDMWCKRPYGFLFSSGEAAESFAASMGTGAALFAVGIDSSALLSDELLTTLREQELTRLFVDPAIDPDSGDVFGAILRLAPLN